MALDGLVVFDGVCGLCSGIVRWVARRDRVGAICFTPIQSPYGRLLCTRQGVDPDDPATFLFFDHGRALKASDAVVALLRRLPAPWSRLSALTALPRPVRDAVYGWAARNRYRLARRRGTCMVPDTDLASRFVEEAPLAEQLEDAAAR